jgi:hypothetical protein
MPRMQQALVEQVFVGNQPSAEGRSTAQQELYDESYMRGALLKTLNNPRTPYHLPLREVVDALLEHGLTPEVVELYNQRFGEFTLSAKLVCLETGRGGYVAQPYIQWTPDIVHALIRLLCSKALVPRLKHCEVCGRYFFDDSLRNNRRHDTPQCTSRASSRRYSRKPRQTA